MADRDRALPYLDGEVFQLDPARVVLLLFKRRDRNGRQRLVHLAAIDGSACGHVTARIVETGDGSADGSTTDTPGDCSGSPELAIACLHGLPTGSHVRALCGRSNKVEGVTVGRPLVILDERISAPWVRWFNGEMHRWRREAPVTTPHGTMVGMPYDNRWPSLCHRCAWVCARRWEKGRPVPPIEERVEHARERFDAVVGQRVRRVPIIGVAR